MPLQKFTHWCNRESVRPSSMVMNSVQVQRCCLLACLLACLLTAWLPRCNLQSVLGGQGQIYFALPASASASLTVSASIIILFLSISATGFLKASFLFSRLVCILACTEGSSAPPCLPSVEATVSPSPPRPSPEEASFQSPCCQFPAPRTAQSGAFCLLL